VQEKVEEEEDKEKEEQSIEDTLEDTKEKVEEELEEAEKNVTASEPDRIDDIEADMSSELEKSVMGLTGATGATGVAGATGATGATRVAGTPAAAEAATNTSHEIHANHNMAESNSSGSAVETPATGTNSTTDPTPPGANGKDVLSSIPRADATRCLSMSKAEWCATKTSRALCGVSRRVCVDLGFVFHESGDCANCLAMKGVTKAVKGMLAKRPAAVATTSRNKANGVLSSIPRVDAEQCLRMSKAEWCATETSRALCGVSRRVCVDLGFVFHESGDCANCLAMKGPAKAVKEMLAKRLPAELS
jgi:hypothetical protein